jgi:HlyD family secretion protein
MAEGRIVDTGKVKAYRPPGQRRQWRLVLLVGALVVGLAVAAYLVLGPRQELYSLRSYNSQEVTRGRLVQTTQASGAVVFPVQMTLVSPEAGSAATLYVQEGDSVQEGQLLAELAATDLEDTLEDLRGDLADAQRSLAKQRLQSRINLERKQRQIDDLAQDITDATAERDEVKSMVAAEVSPPSDLQAAERTLQGLIGDREEQILQLAEDREIAALEDQVSLASIAALQVEIGRQQDKIAAMSVTAPIDGEVLEIASELGIPGSRITANQTLFTVADPGSAVIDLEVLEQYAGALQLGQPVELGIGTLGLTGTVAAVGRVAQQSPDGLGATVLVRVQPDPDAGPLLSGATAVGVMEVGVTEDALLLPRGAYLTTGSQRYLYRIEGDRAVKIAVTFGQVEGNVVEVLTGVEAGDPIIVSGYQNFIEHDTLVLEGSDG